MEANFLVETDTERPNETIVKIQFLHDSEQSVNIGKLKQMVYEFIHETDDK